MENLPESLRELYEKHHQYSETTATASEITEVFSAIISDFTKLYVVVDALDECSDELRWALIEELTRHVGKMRLLVTSRFLDSIAEELESFPRFEIKANKADVELFIDRQIRKNRSLNKV